MRRVAAPLLLLLLLRAIAGATPRLDFDPDAKRWVLSNDLLEVRLSLTPEGFFTLESLRQTGTGDSWSVPAGSILSPICLQTDSAQFDGRTSYLLVSTQVLPIAREGLRQSIVLQDSQGLAQFRVDLDLWDGQPAVRYSVTFLNLQQSTTFVTRADMLPWRFVDQGARFRTMSVTQWAVAPSLENFEPVETALEPDGAAVVLNTGASAVHCAWLALADGGGRGLVAGLEFDGRATVSVTHLAAEGALKLEALIDELHHPVGRYQEFTVPAAFLGLFHGGWDEAGYRTQQFAEAAIARDPGDVNNFPYVVWDSWGYGTAIDEQTLRRNADLAASLGIELFLVDLGWAPRLGDWYADPDRFPSGLRALADYVHSLGMKFGLHFAFAEAGAGSEVLQAHPDWTSSENYGYFGAQSLCLSNQATRDWLVDQAVHLIDDYSVDWILQDGQNMVKRCTKDTHSHDPQDSNYANSVEGLNQFVDAVERLRPSVAWENCENGGSMMTFGMVRRYVTSIVNDASGSLAARQAAYGASYPFSPRYIDRYMPESDLQPYVTRSYMLGGPWVFMNRLPELSDDNLAFAASEIRVFKTMRARARSGKVFHLTPQPVEGEIDALQNYNATSDTAVAVVERADAKQSTYLLKPQGLNPDTIYLVRFQDDLRSFIVPGDQLMQRGVQVPLPGSLDAEIVYIEPFQ